MTLKPMLAASAGELPTGPQWTYEVKWDGYRALAIRDGTHILLWSRNQKDLTRDYPTIAAALRSAKTPRFVLDGEIVALDAEGRPSFQALQHRRTSSMALAYYAFDVLSVGGESLMQQPLSARRHRLRPLVAGTGILLSEPLPGTPAHIEHEILRLRLEGVIAKRIDSIYRPCERSNAWVKVKFSPQQEFVIGGYKPSTANFESVLVGYYERRKLHFAAKVRAGLTPHLRAEVFRQIANRPLKPCPFVDLPNAARASRWSEGITAEDMLTLKWVKPVVVIQVAFVEWTDGGLLRHPQFVGLRDDVKAGDVNRERS